MEKYVFISYSSKDSATAKDICEYLKEKDIKYWIAPQSLLAGEDYPSQIVEAIRNCSVFVLLASHSTNVSNHVKNEVASAFDAGKPLVAMLLENIEFSDEYLYYLKRKHWIDAYTDIDEAQKQLCITLSTHLGDKSNIEFNNDKYNNVKFANQKLDRKGIAERLKKLTSKYSYSLYERLKTEQKYAEFAEQANILIKNTVKLEYCGKKLDSLENYVEFASKVLCDNSNVSMQVLGLPGSAKNMLLQLVFFNIMDKFVNNKCDCLPIYLSVGFYERNANADDINQDEVKKCLATDLEDFIGYLKDNINIRPIVFIDGIREYITDRIPMEALIAKTLEPIGRYNKMTSVDVGLIKNRQRLKRFIQIAGDFKGGYVFRTESIDIENREKVLEVIDCVFKLYDYNLNPEEVYNLLVKYKFNQIDIYLIRLMAKECYASYMISEKSLADIYESIALTEYGNEEQLVNASKHIFEYIFADKNINLHNLSSSSKVWSLPNRHHTCLDFLLAYYLTYSIKTYTSSEDYSFFKMILTSTANQFIVSMLKDDYELQETFYNFISSKYEIFDARQKSNAAYWLGRLNYSNNITNQSLTFLTGQFTKLKALVKTNNKFTQENMDNHSVFRAVCTAMLFHGQANIMDEYLCIVITNDVANALNRGFAVEYFGNDYEMCAFNEYYLDSDLTRGEAAIKMLNKRIEASLYQKNGKFVENNLVTLLTLLQARIQTKNDNFGYDIKAYVGKALKYLKEYKFKPQNIASTKIIFYFESMKDDLEMYLKHGAFDIGPMLYNRCKFMKSVKREQWVHHNIDDPESVSEHVFSSWLMAMLLLPEESKFEGYNKKEILDMLLIHDMAQTVQGESNEVTPITKKLEFKTENNIMRKFFLKGTYPDIANLTYFYNVWTGYYNGININAKIAQDINLIQAIYTFCEYYSEYRQNFTEDDYQEWVNAKARIVTEIGYQIYDRLIVNNSAFKSIINKDN